ncbi:MAG: hypothetical protein KGZ97_01545 [Bacteroidetes bacterium]|nr:hypothetical protein [Bacteroidota bacterium]
MWKEVFKAGKHTDANGNEREWSSEDIDTIISKYNNQMPDDKHEAPVVIGHPVNNSPAYAWVESLKKDGETLLAKFTQIDPEFEQLIKEGRYKKVSIALYPDMMLRHIGFLGAIPPAVKGLKDSEFNGSESFICFGELKGSTITTETEQNDMNAGTNNKQNLNTKEQMFNTCSTDVEQSGNKIQQIKLKEIKVKEKEIFNSSPPKSEISEEGKEYANFFKGLLPPTQKVTEADLKNWADTFDKLVRIDKRSKDEVYQVTEWARKDSFWGEQGNFLSACKLRNKSKDGVLYYDMFLQKFKQRSKSNGTSQGQQVQRPDWVKAKE